MIIVIIVDIGVKGIVRCMKGGMEFMTEKRFNLVGGYVYDKDKCISHFEDVKHRDEIIGLLNDLNEENEQLKHNNKMLSMKMSEVSTKYRLLKEFSEDTNPNEAVKTVLHELMMITKEYR